jgi:4-diphosphocytidyl-2-C-methyl-D-erythritol kinase
VSSYAAREPRFSAVSIRAPAKINLGLVIGERRADGFHDLETVFARINLYDDLRIEARELDAEDRDRVTLAIELVKKVEVEEKAVLGLPTGKDNLCVKAALFFLDEAGIKEQGVNIRLLKRIPIGAGLGGGSSDAAAVLTAMNRLFGRPLVHDKLARLAAQLGSDVPFFLCPGACRASGRGEVLTPVRIPKLHLLVYVPDFPVNTSWAYRELDKRRAEQAQLTSRSFSLKLQASSIKLQASSSKLEGLRLAACGLRLDNSFEEIVFHFHPELSRIKARLLAAGAPAVSLSGSGSTLYAVVSPAQRRRVKRMLEREGIRLLSVETIRGAVQTAKCKMQSAKFAV